jgi:hypothetical protein
VVHVEINGDVFILIYVLIDSHNKKKALTTTHFCVGCSASRKGKVWLCNKTRNHPSLVGLTCTQIRHGLWGSGDFAPKKTRDRAIRPPLVPFGAV